jgi:hypothetical protein
LYHKLNEALYNISVDDIVSNEDVIRYIIDRSFAYKKLLGNTFDSIFPLNLRGA